MKVNRFGRLQEIILKTSVKHIFLPLLLTMTNHFERESRLICKAFLHYFQPESTWGFSVLFPVTDAIQEVNFRGNHTLSILQEIDKYKMVCFAVLSNCLSTNGSKLNTTHFKNEFQFLSL